MDSKVGTENIYQLIDSILDIMDNLELALVTAADKEALHEGVRAIHRKLTDLLYTYDLRPFISVEKPFDPNFHEALGVDYSESLPPNHVTREFQRGYMKGEHLYRPAKVFVSTQKRAQDMKGFSNIKAPVQPASAAAGDRSAVNRPLWVRKPPEHTDAKLYFVGSSLGVSSAEEGRSQAGDQVLMKIIEEAASRSDSAVNSAYREVLKALQSRKLEGAWNRLEADVRGAKQWVEDLFWEKVKGDIAGTSFNVSILVVVNRIDLDAILALHGNPEKWGGLSIHNLGPLLSCIVPDLKGGIVSAVFPASISSRAGLQVGDIITKVDNKPISSAVEVRRTLTLTANYKQSIDISFMRSLVPSGPVQVPGRRAGKRR